MDTDTQREPLVTIREMFEQTARDGWKLKETSMTLSNMTIEQFMSLDLNPIRQRHHREGMAEAARRNREGL